MLIKVKFGGGVFVVIDDLDNIFSGDKLLFLGKDRRYKGMICICIIFLKFLIGWILNFYFLNFLFSWNICLIMELIL